MFSDTEFAAGFAAAVGLKVVWVMLKAGTAWLRARARQTEGTGDDEALEIIDRALGDKPPGSK